MENDVNRLNACLKQFGAVGIRFDYRELAKAKSDIAVMLPYSESYLILKILNDDDEYTVGDLMEYAHFSNVDNLLSGITNVYHDIKFKREYVMSHHDIRMSIRFAYQKINLASIKFLEILSTCTSIDELELKIAIYMGK